MPERKSEEIQAVPISAKFDLSNFDCGVPDLNIYLQRYAGQNHRKGIGRTYLGIISDKVCGFYTVSMAEIHFESLPEKDRKKVPKYPLPAMRLGRLAVDENFKGQGIGEHLLMDALSLSSRLNDQVGVYCVIVDAKDNSAVRFYKKYGFIPFQDRVNSLFLPMKTVLKAFQWWISFLRCPNEP